MAQKIKHISSEFSICCTFLLLITFGVFLLHLPFVNHVQELSFLDALFTATSAVCVTGLVTVPTSGFNLYGQIILLILMQLGAIGIMTITSSLILFFRGDLNLRMRVEAHQLTESNSLAEVERVLAAIIKYTAVTELIGFALLAIGFHLQGFSFQQSLYQAIFHTISSFCNAGFSPFDQSLTGCNPLIKYTVMLLIVFGGIGYLVIFDVIEYYKKKEHLNLHSKSVLLLTPLLIIAGTIIFLMVEGEHITVTDALFQSITARTAGFNTIDLTQLQTISCLTLIALMVIGAAPGSTGGGVKITCLFVSLVTIFQVIRGSSTVTIFGKKLPLDNILRAFVLIFLYLTILALGTALLLYFEKSPFIETLFEMASAQGTVGLSLGLTSAIGPAGKIILISGMFIGRIGPAVLMLVLFKRQKVSHVDYPEEKIILG